MKIYAISGHAQNGKDTVATMLANKLKADGSRVLITHNADLLKYICRTFFDWDGKKDEHGRNILQYIGTDVVRKKAPNFWVNFIASILTIFDGTWDYVIVPDSRFPNEIDVLKRNGFDVSHLRVVRHNYVSPLTTEQQNHPSETAMDLIVPDFTITNDGTMEDLATQVDAYIKEKIYGHKG